METHSRFTKIVKKYFGILFAVVFVIIAARDMYFKDAPRESAPNETEEDSNLLPDNVGVLYPDEVSTPPPLPNNVMPRHPTIYKSHGQITANVIHREKTQYGDVVVFDTHNTIRCFLMDGVNESCWNFRLEAPSLYTRHEKLILEHLTSMREVEDVLVIGVGAGTLLKDLDGAGFKVDGVDINPAMKPMAEKFFILPENLDYQYITDDGRHFLNTTDKKYDVIVLDLCYVNDANAHLWTKEFYALAKTRLKDPDTGALIASRGIVVDEENTKLDNMIANAMAESFPHLYQVLKPNMRPDDFDMGVYVASAAPVDFSGLDDPSIVPWEYDSPQRSTTDALLDELVSLFLPAAEKIREQTLTNFGKDIFLPL